MPNPIEAQIKDRISTFVTDLDLLVRRSALEALRGVLADGAAPARRGRPAGPGRGPGRARGSANVESAASSILGYVRANDGQGVGQIAAGAGVALPVAKKVIIQLLAAGQLKKTGQKRGTRYHIGSGAKRAKSRGRKRKVA